MDVMAMAKGKVLTCPACGRTYEQVKDETATCNGKVTPDTIPHTRKVMK